MSASRDPAISVLLGRLAEGEREAAEELATAVVDQLERIADGELRRQLPGGLHGLTLEPRIFAHDALLKILDSPLSFENRRHFFSYAAQIMARAIVDYQRSRAAQKRGGDQIRISLRFVDEASEIDALEVMQLLSALEALDPGKADLVRLRVFLGATMEEAAEALGKSLSGVERDWRFVRSWLASRIANADGSAHADADAESKP